jgi:2-polyprenyl-3-methyl-5-hydroxy-6-metoxy-1,4-benzoquinol methylase
VTEPSTRNHYSYSVYADPATARTFDDRRFGGPIGDLVAGSQARVLTEAIAPAAGLRVLDVGTGTGRAALLLARAGAVVTGVDASDEMLAVARSRAAEERLAVAFERGDAHVLAFPARAFDAVVSLRVLMHTPDWRRCLSEYCRVADRLVVLDYPSALSVATVQAAGRRLARVCGVKTEAYRVFHDRTIAHALSAEGFDVRVVHKQFVLPIAFHKAIGSRAFTEHLEAFLKRAGLLGLFGSPVTVVAERCARS